MDILSDGVASLSGTVRGGAANPLQRAGVASVHELLRESSMTLTRETKVFLAACAAVAAGGLAVVWFSISRMLEEGRMGATEQAIAALNTATQLFDRDCGRVPTRDEGLRAFLVRPDACAKWRPMLESEEGLLDGWGHPFKYEPPHESGGCATVRSAGPDGKWGTGDDISARLERFRPRTSEDNHRR